MLGYQNCIFLLPRVQYCLEGSLHQRSSFLYVTSHKIMPGHLRMIFSFNPLKSCIKMHAKKLSIKKWWANEVFFYFYYCVQSFRPLFFWVSIFAFFSTVPKTASNFAFYETHLNLWPKNFVAKFWQFRRQTRTKQLQKMEKRISQMCLKILFRIRFWSGSFHFVKKVQNRCTYMSSYLVVTGFIVDNSFSW